MLSYKESDRADPARGHQRGRLGRVVHRGRHVVRDARRADDPGLHLLLDVRLPADRRRLLGGRRPDGARLRARRHRRAYDAQRRGPAARGRPLAAARLDQPGGRRLRPGVRLRDRAHRARRPAPDVRRRPGERLLLPDALQRAVRPAGRAGRRRRRRHPARDAPVAPAADLGGRGPARAAAGVGRLGAVGASAPRSCCATTGACRPTCGR